LWADAHWPERRESLSRFLSYHRPDILALQELRPVTRDVLDQLLPDYERVYDPFPGWHEEGNLYWNTALFTMVEYGAAEIGHMAEFRRLFWVRLQPRVQPDGPVLFVATAHYTWPGHKQEEKTGYNPRLEQARQTVTALNRLTQPEEPLLFMGDLNDFRHPLRILREGGLQEAFTALGRKSPVTRPSLMQRHERAPQVSDWVLHRGPLRPMTCEVVDFFANGVPPSDHKPVLVTYALA
jgi:endonuclease/exonuclease/phosphatase (EEP) superfamily protein YafD